MLPLKNNRAYTRDTILLNITHRYEYLEIFLLQSTEQTLITGHVERSSTVKKPTTSHHE